jgi:hypothetical protein
MAIWTLRRLRSSTQARAVLVAGLENAARFVMAVASSTTVQIGAKPAMETDKRERGNRKRRRKGI